MKNQLYISIDAETVSLRGDVFAISVVSDDEVLFEKRVAKISDWPDEWVRDHVWPQCLSITSVVPDTASLYQEFSDWWLDAQMHYECVVIAHCPNPVETGLFNKIATAGYFNRSLDKLGMLETYNPWDSNSPKASPLCIHDVGTLLHLTGRSVASVDSFLNDLGVGARIKGKPHHPRYDAIAALTAWQVLEEIVKDDRPLEKKRYDYMRHDQLYKCVSFDPVNGGRPQYAGGITITNAHLS